MGSWLVQWQDDGPCSVPMQGNCSSRPSSVSGDPLNVIDAPGRCMILTDQAIVFDWTDVDAAANVWIHGLHFYRASSVGPQGVYVAFAPSNTHSSLWLTDMVTEGAINGVETAARMTLIASASRIEQGP
jgi:hypothetical protein